MDTKSPKVMVLGLDGADSGIIEPLMAVGKLPHIASLMKEGTRGSLKSTVMPNSFPAWVSCLTGVNPGKHGIYWPLIRRGGSAYPLRLMNSSDIRAKRLWDLLGAQGRRVGVVNVPTEYPPAEVNGFLVCGALTPGMDSDFTYPPGLRDEVSAAVPGSRCAIESADLNLERLADQILGSIENREKLVLHLLEERDWDLFVAVFTETDLTQHKFWAGIDPKHPDHARFEKRYGTFVHDVYQRLDETVGRVIQKIPEDAFIFVISDHGFGPFYQSFSLPRWLRENGYLDVRKPTPWARIKNLLVAAMGPQKAGWMKRTLSSFKGASKKNRTVRIQRERDESSGEAASKKIVWERTKAYHTADYGIRINVKGREPQGIVAPGAEANLLIKEMAEKLKRLRYSNGEPVFEAVLAKEEAFSGPFVQEAPDLIVPINHAKAPPAPEQWNYALTHPTLTGTHAPQGVFIGRGPGIRVGAIIQGAEIVDITPTILYLFDAPLTEDMDGAVLFDLFTPESKASRKVVRKGSSLKDRSGEEVLSGEERQRLEERLKNLGYID
jgi:predicted AlkP superfamily phosphohydrolase/phosphomutase